MVFKELMFEMTKLNCKNAECGTYFILLEDSFPCTVRIDALSSHGSHFSSDCVVWEHLKVIQIFKKLSIEMYI